jgi:chlorite dismutase
VAGTPVRAGQDVGMSSPDAVSTSPAPPTADEINAGIRYTLYSVYSRVGELEVSTADAAAEVSDMVASLTAMDVEIRGFYDLTGMRADADLMVWWHANSAEQLQSATRALRRTWLGQVLSPSWSAMGVHRPAEFNKGHVPAFLSGADPRAWLCVYPFVRSYEWYLLPEEERRTMLAEHGRKGRAFETVLSNTVASFALGDYEWLLALESDHLHDLLDLMRDLRATQARRHVREEVPFFTGRRVEVAGVVEALR